ncbi:MAG: helix-turn-helix domain-containing protein [Halocynthiibacter sp.]
MFSIGQLSRKTGVKVPTIRYYEQIGMVDKPGRTEGNQRRYSQSDLNRLAFVRHARDLGLPLDAIRELVALGEHPEKSCAEADRIATEQLAEVQARIRQLSRLEVELRRMAKGCDNGTVSECYVLQSLSDHALCDGDHDIAPPRRSRSRRSL